MSLNPLKNKILDFKAIIFDMDGTLVDSMWMWHAIDVEYLGRFQITLPKDLQQKIEGMSFSETAVYFKENFAISDSLEQIKKDWIEMACEKYEKEVFYKEGALEFLQFCKTHGILLGIATSNARELVTSADESLSLSTYFSCILTACEVQKGKPAPDVYLEVAKRLQVSPENCLVFEDIIPGILAGKAAKMQVCAVEDDYSLNIKEEKTALSDYYIKSYKELL